MSISSKYAVMRIFVFAVVLTIFSTAISSANAACRPFTVYTKNTQRSVIPGGPDGPLGDLVVANGLIFETPSDSATPVGTFDLSAITTSVNTTTERRQVFIETSFDKSFTRKMNKPKILCGTHKGFSLRNLAPTDDISLSGVETYPIGGGILTTPIVFGINSGVGQFVGASGSVHISYDPVTKFFAYEFTLLPR